jgi:hypothetical protein
MPLLFDRVAKVATLPEADGATITIQDIYNQFRDFEDEPQNLDLRKTIDGAGKDDLGGGQFTVITVTLRDGWRVAFEARPGPATEIMTITAGNLVATDEAGDPQFPVAPTAFTHVVIAQATTGAIIETAGGGGATVQEIFDYVPVSHVSGSFGELAFKKLVKFAEAVGLIRR